MALTFAKPVAKPLYGFNGVEVIGGKIASPLRKRTLNDPATFEITQTAAQHIASGRGTGTAAIDIGNGFCGEPILAMADGVAQRVVDPSGALGARVVHSPRISSEYWHFEAWSIGPGSVSVKAGDRLGYLGKSGLSVGGCHCHIEVKIDGIATDPEPYVLLGLPLPEDDVLVAKTQPLQESIRVVTGAGNAIRTDTHASDATLDYRTPAGAQFTVIGFAAGDVYDGSDRWYVFLKRGEGLRAIHSKLCQILPEPAPAPPDCSAEVAAATAAGAKRVDAIKGVLAKAVQEIAGL